MENKKDINVKYNGQIKDDSSTGVVLDDAYVDFLIKKTEKFVTAVYLITNLIKDTEPVKWELRKVALSFISQAMSLVSVELPERRQSIKDILNSCRKILTFSDIARFSGIVSEMNWAILKQELTLFISNIELKEKIKDRSSDIIFSESFFSVSNVFHKGHSSDNQKDMVSFFSNKNQQNKNSIKDTVVNIKDVFNNSQSKGVVGKYREEISFADLNNKTNKTNRKDIIISLLKKTNNLTVKDLSGVIKDCSEKTIQRELLDMVGNGVLKKEGERRWSRYSLN